MNNDKKHLQDLMRQLLILIGDLNDLEKVFSRLRNETNELRKSIKKKLKTTN